MFEGKKILITGGTGSLGQALTERILTQNPAQIRIFSRNELKQISMESSFSDKRLRFLIGDIRDLGRLIRATEDVDFVFHAAALKHVDKVEFNPFEAIKTNVDGTQNVIDACLQNDVKKAICIGTDKAVSPLNTYGATKLLMEKLFASAIHYSNPKKHPTKFIAVRYGNVFGSSGSVIPKFIEQIKNKQKITITDPNGSLKTYSLKYYNQIHDDKNNPLIYYENIITVPFMSIDDEMISNIITAKKNPININCTISFELRRI